MVTVVNSAAMIVASSMRPLFILCAAPWFRYWFHAVVSLSQTVQCNSFVGGPSTTSAQDHVEDCMMKISGEVLHQPSPLLVARSADQSHRINKDEL